MVASPGYVLGLDLHGTLLEPGEIIRDEMVTPVARALSRLAGCVTRFLCTGNDLEFVRRKVPKPILGQIDGCVLETGCSMSPDLEREEVITTEQERGVIKQLEQALRNRSFPAVNYFAHRLTTISMFCDDPRGFFREVSEFVKAAGFGGVVHVTYSSVAVDILPAGYDKERGLRMAAGGKLTIGVADSMNDRALLERADFAMAPANIAPELRPLLREAGREIVPLDSADRLSKDAVLVAAEGETQGVIRILDFIDRAVPPAGRG